MRKTLGLWIVILMMAVTTAAAAQGATGLGDDLLAFEAVVDGVYYQYPCAFQSMLDNGWTAKDDMDQVLLPSQYGLFYFNKGEMTGVAYVYNCGSNAVPMRDALIAGVWQDVDTHRAYASCELPGGIRLGESSMDEAIARYGEPSRRYDGTTRTALTYTYDTYRDIELSFGEDNVLNTIKIQNLTTPDWFVDELGDIDTPPAIVGRYRAPEALGDSMDAYVAQLAGDLYQLPAPVQAFLDNGWKILPDRSEAMAKGAGSAWVTLSKDNQQLRVLAKNYSDHATVVQNCFVNEIEVSPYKANLKMALPLGIETGMTREALLAALEPLTVFPDESSSFEYYEIAEKENAVNGITIGVTKESGLVTHITVEHDVRFSEIDAWFDQLG